MKKDRTFRVISRFVISLLLIISNLAYTAPVFAVDEHGNIPHPNPGSVALDKTATELGDGLYEITLTVSGIPVVTPTDIVLVIDRSGSMTSSKMNAAKQAAKNFIDDIIGLNQGHRIAIVSFADNSTLNHSLSSDIVSLKSAVDGISAVGGTHLEAGIKAATDLLASSTNRKAMIVLGDGEPTYGFDFNMEYNGPVTTTNRPGNRCRVEVESADQLNDANFIGGRYDFIFNQRVGTGNTRTFVKTFDFFGTCPNGSSNDDEFDRTFDLKDSVVWFANQAMAANIKMFSVGLEVSTSGRDVLESIQNSGYYPANSSNLGQIYDAISAQIVHAAKNAVVVDKIGDNFEFHSISPGYTSMDTSYNASTRILTWNVGDVGASEIILKYRVSIHNGLPAGQYPTNEYANLEYTNIHNQPALKIFPKPYVPVNNEPPVAQDSSFTLARGSNHSASAIGHDPNGDAVTFILVSDVSNGTLTFNSDGTFNYTHNGTPTSSDSFTFKVTDGDLESNVATVTITVTYQNQPPVANDDAFTVDEGGTHSDSVTASDPEDDDLTFILVSGTVNGTLVFNADGTYTYTHNGSETTSDSFTFKANDGELDSNIATVTITIIPDEVLGDDDDNLAPVANDDEFTIGQGDTYSDVLTGTDPENDELTFILVSGPSNGTLELNPNGTYTYTHNNSKTTSDSFTFLISDGVNDSNIATVTITIELDEVKGDDDDLPDTSDHSRDYIYFTFILGLLLVLLARKKEEELH